LTGGAAEVFSSDTVQQRGSNTSIDVRSASRFDRCASEIRGVLGDDQLGIRFFLVDRAGRLRARYRGGRPIDLGRRQVLARRRSLIEGTATSLEGGDRGSVGFFPIDGGGRVIGVAEISSAGEPPARRREVEAAIGRLSDRLRRDANPQGELDIGLAWVAHELRGPLLATRFCLENTADRVDPGPARSILRAADELRRLASGLESLLDLAVGDGPIRRRPVDLAVLVHEAADCCLAEVGDGRVVIEETHPLAVVADPLHLRSAIENLIRNALRYSTPGTTVLVIVERRDEQAVVEVRDEGDGIRPEDRERVFEPLTRGPSDVGGTGMGLFVARRVAERHGGTIRYHEPRDGLSAFELRLPVKESA
jgi:signal transduction histidine kinase